MFKSTDAAALSCCLLCDISWVDRDMSSHLGYRDSSGILRSDVIQVQTDETLGTQKHTITDTGSYYQEVPTPRKPSTTHTLAPTRLQAAGTSGSEDWIPAGSPTPSRRLNSPILTSIDLATKLALLIS